MNTELLTGARNEVDHRRGEPYGLGRAWFLIDELIKLVDELQAREALSKCQPQTPATPDGDEQP